MILITNIRLMKIHILIIFLFFSIAIVSAQQAFVRQDNLIAEMDAYSGVTIAIADMNGDLLDDIVFNDGRDIYVAYQNINNLSFTVDSIGQIPGTGWSIAVGDLDRNASNDIMVCDGSDAHLFFNHNQQFEYRFLDLPSGYFPQTSHFIDFDQDGFLDIFILNDVGANLLLLNRDGDYIETPILDDTDGGTYDGSGNYGSVWSDIDADGDLDLFIAKCRAFASDSTDKRRINRLYIQDEGGFVNRATELGVASGRQSWSVDIGDINNDGLQDIFITNHYAQNQLYIQRADGVFDDVSHWISVDDSGFAFQSLMVDVNNDSWLDILIAGTKNLLFINEQGKGFAATEMMLGRKASTSFNIGDLNHDGYPDIVAAYPKDIVERGDFKNLVWINAYPKTHHYIKISLLGTMSNWDAVGARLLLYGPWGVQTREIRVGESYGVSRSSTVCFGMGETNIADSLVIYWPSGHIERLENLASDSHYQIKEGLCMQVLQHIEIQETPTLCFEDSIILRTKNEQVVLWNTGVLSDTLVVRTPGSYWAKTQEEEACFESIVSAWKVDYYQTDPELYNGDLDICGSEPILLEAPPGNHYRWNTGDTSSTIWATLPINYQLQFKDVCGNDQQIETGKLEFFEMQIPEVVHDTIDAPGELVLVAHGQNIIWYADQEKKIELSRNDTLYLYAEKDTVVYAASSTFEVENQDTIIRQNLLGASGVPASSINGGLYFDVLRPIRIESLMVFGSSNGQRSIIVYDQSGDVVYQQDFEISEGSNTLQLDAQLSPGTDYFITTDTTVNIQRSGKKGPDLVFFKMSEHFPIGDPSRILVTGSNFGSSLFWYFTDWQIVDADPCTSEAVPVYGIVDRGTNTSDLPLQFLEIYPNPSNGSVHFKLDKIPLVRLELMDTGGRLLKSVDLEHITAYQWDLTDLESGLYLIKVFDLNTKHTSVNKWIKY